MRAAEFKRMAGYQDLVITQCCGTCTRLERRKKHLRCSRFNFAVTENGICRVGYEKSYPPRPYGAAEPLLAGGGQ